MEPFVIKISGANHKMIMDFYVLLESRSSGFKRHRVDDNDDDDDDDNDNDNGDNKKLKKIKR